MMKFKYLMRRLVKWIFNPLMDRAVSCSTLPSYKQGQASFPNFLFLVRIWFKIFLKINVFKVSWRFNRTLDLKLKITIFLFETFADALSRSQFPVYTIYAHKTCLTRASELCARRPWAYELVPAFRMAAHVREKRRAANRRACMELCLNERTFQCRWDLFEYKPPGKSDVELFLFDTCLQLWWLLNCGLLYS